MPRFHFHIRSAGGALVRDEAGMYLPDLDAARDRSSRGQKFRRGHC